MRVTHPALQVTLDLLLRLNLVAPLICAFAAAVALNLGLPGPRVGQISLLELLVFGLSSAATFLLLLIELVLHILVLGEHYKFKLFNKWPTQFQ
mgnify:CR=1 FL=1